MQRFDRYVLSQLMILFGFFALVLVAIYWVNNAVQLFDSLIADGHSTRVFVEFSLLSLPSVIALVLPMAGFAASVYVTNRMSTDSELTVMQATGFSPWRVARPVLVFALILAAIMSVLTHFLLPMSAGQLRERERDLSASLTAQLLREGAFLHPADGVTFYTREISDTGQMRDVMLADRRDPEREIVYTSDRAYLVQDDIGAKMVMLQGTAQVLEQATQQLATTHFSDFTYDIGSLIAPGGAVRRSRDTIFTPELLTRPNAVAEEVRNRKAEVLEEAHMRFQMAGLCIVAALIGHAALLTGGYSRFGVTKQIVFAIGLLVLVKIVESAVTDPVRSDARLWPLVYAPVLAGLIIAWGLLHMAARPFRRRRAHPGGAAA